MELTKVGGFEFPQRKFGAATAKPKQQNQNNSSVNIFPGAAAGLATGGVAYGTLARVEKESKGIVSRNSLVSRTFGSLAKGTDNIFKKEALSKAANTRAGRLGAAGAIALGTFAAVTGVIETAKDAITGANKVK